MNYVVGFMFDAKMNQVALIRKNKPKWQSGLLNGIGGKIENGETSLAALMREFWEEAGFSEANGCKPVTWNNFCSMEGTNNDGEHFSVEFFYSIGEPEKLKTQEAEKIELVLVDDILIGKENTIGNIPWLIALAMDFGKGVYPPSKCNVFYGVGMDRKPAK